MKVLFDAADIYLKQSTWKDLALVKFCLFSIGLLCGLFAKALAAAGAKVGGLIGQSIGGKVSRSYSFADVITTGTKDTNVGGLIGKIDKSLLENSYANGNILANADAGGLVGKAYEATIVNCYSMGIINGDGIVGGLVGIAQYNSTITLSYSTAEITGSSSGGLIGELDSSIIIRSYATGDVNGISYGGGLVGNMQISAGTNGGIVDSYSTGNVTADGSYKVYAGGLVGNSRNGYITNSYSTGNVVSNNSSESSNRETYAGGIIGCSLGTRINNSYASGNITANGKKGEVKAGGLIGWGSTSNNYKYEQQIVISQKDSNNSDINESGISASMQTIWQFVYDNWDNTIWNLSLTENPTLK